jgi:hypothetical protein
MSNLQIQDEPKDIHTWFSLTYANYLVLPRAILQSMPVEWQNGFVCHLEALQEAYSHMDFPEYRVTCVDERGRFTKDPTPHYQRGRTYIPPREAGTGGWCRIPGCGCDGEPHA